MSIRVLIVSEHIYQAYGRLCGSEIVPLEIGLLVAAVRTRELVVIEVEIPHAEGSLQVPVLVQQPLVSVTDAKARPPSLPTLVLQV